jgi:hypothetical protein
VTRSTRAWQSDASTTVFVALAKALSSAVTSYDPGAAGCTRYAPSVSVDVTSGAPPAFGTTVTVAPGSFAWPAVTVPLIVHPGGVACGEASGL